MKWPVFFIGIVLVAGVLVFAVSYGPPHASNISVSSASSTFPSTDDTGSGVRGRVQVTCSAGTLDMSCLPQIRTVEAYQGISSVGLFKTAEDGSFRSELPPGQYELRVDTASSTHCVSVGVVVTEHSYISTNISCEATSLE